MKLLLVAALAGGARAACLDNPNFVDELGNPCSFYASLDSCLNAVGLSQFGLDSVLLECQLSCNTCVRASGVCEIGVGGAVVDVPATTDNFDFSQELPEPFLSDTCEWIDTPEGLRQTTNAWGNRPGENQVMGCMAVVKNSMYTDFIMEVDARHEDNDASGIIFGMDPANPEMFYKSMMFNDDWLDNPTDGVNGPFLKLNKRNGKVCNGTMTVDTDCYDLLSYVTNDLETSFNASWLPNGALTSHGFIPDAYTPAYDYFAQRSTLSGIAKTVKYTLVVYQGEARVYFATRNNLVTGTWAKLPADYAGGMVGLWMSAHQATYTSIKIADLSAGAAPFTNPCKAPGATCDTSVGLCVGGPSFAPTSFPTPAPTFFDNCQDPYRHAASDFCPNPTGGDVTTYDVTDLNAWELVQLEPVSENCTWSADAAGLAQTSNAWGTYPTSLLLVGCVALVPDTYTDFIAEYEAVHFDNDAWGFVFGWSGVLDHYTAATHNDAWPSNALDGISGPFTKIRKTTGLPCSDTMSVAEACYETLGYTDANGFSDSGNVKTITQRAKEYEYSHAYEASAQFQPAKITLIVQGQEARIMYKSPDTIFDDIPANNVRMGNKYQAAMTFDLSGYTGGRVGIFMSAHQMVINNFKITDISDPANLPTGYCSGAFCDAGVTGLCLGIAAQGVCEGAVGPDVYDMTNLDVFDYIEDATLGTSCSWQYGPNGYISQSTNAFRNDGVILGCNALTTDAAPAYTDFVAEMWLSNNDNDAIGFNFGWQSENDFFRVYKINDVWNMDHADYVDQPHFKVLRKRPDVSCAGDINASNYCFQTIAFVDKQGAFHADISPDAVTASGECGYSQVYLEYDQADRSKMYLIVKDNQMRATYESPLSRRQVTAMAFDLGKYGYAGGKVGVFMSAHQAEFFEFTVADLTSVTQFCDGDPCADRSGRCLGSPTMSPTFVPTATPTVFPTPNVAANEFCQGPVGGATTMVDTTDLSQFLLVDHPLLTTSCVWTADASGLSQTSEAWGNAPGDNTLMGCMAMYNGASYTDFIAEIDVAQVDNDGWGVVFGYNSVDDHYLGIAMNDRWPLPAADGIAGPFLKIKKTNGNQCQPTMDATNNCFDTLSHLDANGFNKDAMQGATGVGLPKEYESTYPFRKGASFEDTKIVLIVSGTEARLFFPSPKLDVGTSVNNLRQTQTATSIWTFDLAGYTGGQVGLFTYAHQATFSNFKITDLTDTSSITGYCDGFADAVCDNQRGDISTGLCHAVPMSDVCEGPIGDGVMQIDTTDLTVFTFIDDPNLTENCSWTLGNTGNLRQTTNAYHSNTVQLGCNALVTNMTFTDFIAQVDIDNDDNDAVGFNFGWQSMDDHFRLHKMNDDWPNPAADGLPGPVMKIRRKLVGISCENAPFNSTNPSCYETISWIDGSGSFHNGMPVGFVSPFEYARTYLPYSEQDTKRLVLMVRDSKLRVIYEDAELNTVVGAFVFDLSPWNYVGGSLGFYMSAHQAEFSNFIVGNLTGPTAVTQFCNGGLCDGRTGLCLTQPTFNPTSRTGDVAAAGICPGPVGGNQVAYDTTDMSLFTFIDQEWLSEPCQWSVDAIGLKQTSNAWGNSPGLSTLMGCIALVGPTYSDFILEVTAAHEDDDGWGYVFGYDQVTAQHYQASVINDEWPQPASDGYQGPFIKLKKTNGAPCVAGQMNETAGNHCYDTISVTDGTGAYIDGVFQTDFAGEYARKYPWKIDDVWPTRKLTLIVKDGEARVMVQGPERIMNTPSNFYRQPDQFVSTWTYNLGALGYVGGRVGLFTFAHQATFYNLTVTDLSDDSNLPASYCNGVGDCLPSGVCTAVPVSDVCESPVGAQVIDTANLNAFQFIEDEGGLTQPCSWSIQDLGRGPFLYQSSNAYGGGGSLDNALLGCNAIVNGPEVTDFVMQFDADNYDNDAPGIVFGWRGVREHFKAHKIIDDWPNPAPDNVPGPNIKIRRRIPDRSCQIDPMNYTNNCYETIAFADDSGVYHQAMVADAVTPWQYASRYFDYEIGRGVENSDVRFVLMVRGQELRVYFTSSQRPDLRIAAFAFDLTPYQYTGGQVGVWTFAHQVQYFDIRMAPLSGAGAATEFCADGGTCNTQTGLCE